LRYFIELSYNGKGYHGWQNQPNAITVQQILEEKLSVLLRSKIEVTGAGRTDTGVHASQMFAHFDAEVEIDASDLVYKLNSILPIDIAIHNLFRVKDEAHARFDAISRTYHYKISTTKNVFKNDFAYQLLLPLDIDKMNEACNILNQYKDFQCFSKSHSDVKTYQCDIKFAKWAIENKELKFIITADRFLRNMVRAIVGTMINIGLGKIEVNDLHKIIESKNRSEAGFSVPARGLYLSQIIYPESIKF